MLLSVRRSTRSNTLSLSVWPVGFTVVSVLQFDVSDIVSDFLHITDSSSDAMSSFEFVKWKSTDVIGTVTLILVEMFSNSLSLSLNSMIR